MIRFQKIKDKSNQYDNTNITMESESVTIPDLLEDFKCFLMACGYPIQWDKDLVIEEDEIEEKEEDE